MSFDHFNINSNFFKSKIEHTHHISDKIKEDKDDKHKKNKKEKESKKEERKTKLDGGKGKHIDKYV